MHRAVEALTCPRTAALVDISFSVPRGQLWAIVGANGAGKSTVLSLISRLRDVDDGAVRVFVTLRCFWLVLYECRLMRPRPQHLVRVMPFPGNDVRDVRQRDLRRIVIGLGQHASLFHRSIRDNLTTDN
jgi:ABC-type multidrug transport system fused ATPase/permease subunit